MWKWILIIGGVVACFIPFIMSGKHNGNGGEKNAQQAVLRPLSGIFRVPAGELIEKDVNGQILPYQLEQRIIVDALGGKKPKGLVFINENLPPVKITERRTVLKVINTGKKDFVRFKNTAGGKEEIVVKARII